MTLDPRASLAQQQASAPAHSAWVNANAGSGKTHVLVNRVMRLLLSGCEPAKIMCLTFTKAAAAEMSNRLFERLGAWVTLPEDKLRSSLAELGEAETDAALLPRARRLFTRALETPGGLKIQTIHAFCERVLQAFPVEAGIVPRFTVLDDRTAAELLAAARDATLAQALAEPQSALGRAAALVTRHAQADDFGAIMKQLLGQRDMLQALLSADGGIAAALAMLRRSLEIGDGETPETVTAGLAIDRKRYATLAALLATGTKMSVESGERLATALQDPAATLLDLRAFLLTKEDDPRSMKSITNKSIGDANPWIADLVASEQQRLRHAMGRLADFERLDATEALLQLGRAIAAAFEIEKRRRGAYDFADLIARTAGLLATGPDAAWVLYKLDGGIEHLLVDEAQDTSPEQWAIIKALTREFFAGSGRHLGAPRTVFAVGDPKQSIFSFQGADPNVFASSHDEFADWTQGAGQRLRDVDLTVSFRSAPEILQAVDAVFAEGRPARQGLDGRHTRDLVHESNRRETTGIVELWPLVEPEETEERQPWTTPVDREPATSPRRRLAAQVAATVSGWIGKRKLAALDRAVRPEDILILVRKRDGLFDALIRALRQHGVPVAGADRLQLPDSIAVMDLLALAQASLMPEDDLSLACVLKSPLLARPLSEEQLMALAIDRGTAMLWDRLQASGDPACQAAAAELGRLAVLAPRTRPFEFFSDVLVKARMRFLSRLGSEANDALDALLSQALAFEEDHPATLAGFLNWFAAGESEIKRNMEQPAGEVRIMTVHGAKGLEAPIVILPDTVSMPDRSRGDPLLMVETGNSGLKLPFWPLSKRFESDGLAKLKAARQEAQHHEYRRLLYVAMTRPRDELYVAGYRGTAKVPDQCWYRLVEEGLSPLLEAADGIRRLGARPEFLAHLPVQSGLAAVKAPSWALAAGDEIVPGAPRAIASGPGGQSAAVPASANRGIVVHRILELLASLPRQQWRQSVERVVAREGLDSALAAEVQRLVETPLMQEVLGAAGGLSEIPLLAELPDGLGQVSGRIDRMVIAPGRILVVDYKTTRRVPASAPDADLSHLRQMAAYRAALARIHPGQTIEMALLYTEGPRLLQLPPELLDKVFVQIAVNRA